MLKSFHWISVLSAASILLIAETGLSRLGAVGSNDSALPNSDTDKLFCYMQATDGRTLDLNSLCKAQSPQVVISNITYDSNFMTGRVVNQSSKTAYHVRINYEVLDQNGSVVERNSIDADPQTLSPGQTATFETVVPANGLVRGTFVAWKEKE